MSIFSRLTSKAIYFVKVPLLLIALTLWATVELFTFIAGFNYSAGGCYCIATWLKSRAELVRPIESDKFVVVLVS